MRLVEAIEGLMDTYNSIDVRTASYLQDNSWHAGHLVVRFRRISVKELENEYAKLIKKYGLIEESNFRVDLTSFSTDHWEKIKENWNKNFICLKPSLAINFPSDNEFNREIQTPNNHNDIDFVNQKWASYHTYSNVGHAEVGRKFLDYNSQAIAHRSRNIFEYLSMILQIPNNYAQQPRHNFIIAPVFFKINSVSFDNQEIHIEGSGYPAQKFDIVVDHYKWDGYRTETPIDKITIPASIEGNPLELRTFEISTKLDNISGTNLFRVDIYRENGVLLDTERGMIGSSWPTMAETTNPFSTIFEKFVPFEEFEKMFLKFQARDSNNFSEVFERAVSWLLNLIGIRAIWLGKNFERSGTGHDKIMMDAIGGYDNNDILLVNVTIGLPKQQDFDQERLYRENLEEKIANKDIKLHSILVSGKSVKGLDDIAKSNDVKLIGLDELKQILDYLKKGKINDARNYFLRESDF